MLHTETDVVLRPWHHFAMAKSRPKQFIREWRVHRGFTQERLADRMGIARSYVSHIEKGKRRYDQLFLEAAADALNCRPWDLIERPPDARDDIREVLDALSPDGRARALAVVQALKDSEEKAA